MHSRQSHHDWSDDAVRGTERLYYTLFEGSPSAVMLTLTNGQITAANPAACAMFGRSEREIRELGRAGIMDPADSRHDALVLERERTGHVHGEASFIRKDGSRFLAEINSMVIGEDPSGRQAFVILRDITARKQQEEALQDTAQRLQTIFDNAGVGIAEVGPDGRVLMVNDRHCEITGRPRDEIVGKVNQILWHPEDGDRCLRFQADLKRGQIQAYTDERRYIRPDGEIVWARVNARRLPSPDGTPPRRLVVVEDITDQKEAERRMRESEEALRTANELLETKILKRTRELVDKAAQLRALAGELTLAEQRERRRVATVLHDSLQQLLVSAKLQVACLDAKVQCDTSPVVADIDHILGEAIKITRSLSSELSPAVLHEGGLRAGLEWLAHWTQTRYGFSVDLTLPAEIPETADDVKILLFESVRELLFNAIKHAHVQRASIDADITDGLLRIFVEDKGPGFDPVALKPVGAAGGGFGLFSIRERLNLIGGKLEVDSAPGMGARFTIALSLSQPAAEGQASEIRVLLVDDHAILREGLARLLGQEKDIAVVGQAADGVAGVALADKLLPDVILMDISMPRLNGVEATRIIHAKHPKISIIGLSMHEDANMASQICSAGASWFLSKGGPASELKRLIRECSKGQPAGA
jgi:PAS domain S-box-containing protein